MQEGQQNKEKRCYIYISYMQDSEENLLAIMHQHTALLSLVKALLQTSLQNSTGIRLYFHSSSICVQCWVTR